MAPLSQEGGMVAFVSGGVSTVQYCVSDTWITITKGTSLGTTGCTIGASTNGQFVYDGSKVKGCFFNGSLGALSIDAPNSPVIPSLAEYPSPQVGTLLFSSLLKEPVYYNGSNWIRTRENQILLTSGTSVPFIVPGFRSFFRVRMWGGGASAKSIVTRACGIGSHPVTCGPQTAGGASTMTGASIVTVSAGGGQANGTTACTTVGAGGVTSGGTSSTSGTTATTRNGANAPIGYLGSAPVGGTGAAAGSNAAGTGGASPGAGGGGCNSYCLTGSPVDQPAFGGSSGAYVERSYSLGQITPGALVYLTVGTGGVDANGTVVRRGAAGGDGQIYLDWD